jgi:hypothetical protein
MSQPASAISQPASVTHALLALSPAGAIQGSVAVRQAPEPGPVRGDRVELYDLFLNAPSPSEDHVWFEDRWMVASLCDE